MSDTNQSARFGIPQTPPQALPLTPEARAKKGIRGWPMDDMLGRTWRVAYLNAYPQWDAWRDRIYDERTLRDTYLRADCAPAVMCGLMLNYNINQIEATVLAEQTDIAELSLAAWNVLVVPDDASYSYSEWMHASLIINGIDPKKVEPCHIPAVLTMLIQLKRTVHPADFIASDRTRATTSSLYALAENPDHAPPEPRRTDEAPVPSPDPAA